MLKVRSWWITPAQGRAGPFCFQPLASWECQVLISFKLRSPHAPWIAVLILGTLASAAWYALESQGQPRWPGGGSRPGLVLGTLGGALIFFEFLLWPRKWPKVRTWRIGRTQVWLRAHIWLGLLTVPLILLHSGFGLGGALTLTLMILFALVIASGVIGLLLQNFIPRRMIENVPSETIYSQIDYVSQQACDNAEKLVLAICGGAVETAGESGREQVAAGEGLGSRPTFVTRGALRTIGKTRGNVLETQVAPDVIPHSEALRVAFEHQIKPYLRRGKASGSPLHLNRKAEECFDNLRSGLPPAAHGVVDDLRELCRRRRQYDEQARLHKILHGWLYVHLPASVALVVLMFLHIYFALRY